MTYYNDNDPKVCAWLRELIREGIIPPGEVDDRSILNIRPHELAGFIQQHFFSGIGGWPFALRLAAWPDDKPVKTGSCPCQPFSIAGKGRAEKDERHLWPAFRDLIAFGEPSITFGEQVASPLGREWLSGVRADLENLGYEVGAADLCAAGVGAPHRRQRLFWVANPQCSKRRPLSKERNDLLDGRDTGREETPGRNGGHREAGRMVLTNGTGRDERPVATKAAGHRSPAEPASSADGVANLQGDERNGPLGDSDATGSTRLADGRATRGVGNPSGARCDRPLEGTEGETRNEARMRVSGETVGNGPWSDYGILPFRDGKFRRVEAGTFPLAHGVPHRVGLLRGYGNAIVPQLAAEFIRASIEALKP